LGDSARARGALRDLRAGLRAGHERLRRQLAAPPPGAAVVAAWLLSGPPAYLPAFAGLELAGRGRERAALQEGERFLRAQPADRAAPSAGIPSAPCGPARTAGLRAVRCPASAALPRGSRCARAARPACNGAPGCAGPGPAPG